MAVTNSGTGVLIDAAGITLAGFTNAAASNIKTQDSTLYTITSNAIGSNSNGQILLGKASGAVATLDSNHTFICTSTQIQGALSSDSPIGNMALSIKGAKLVFTSDAQKSEITVPMIGDTETQVIYRAVGTTWNSIHPAVNIDGSTFVFQAGGDGHLGRHPTATLKNPKLIFTSTSPSNFVLGANQAWGADNKPSAMDGFKLQSIRGNTLVSVFTWMVTQIPGILPNNYFFVCKDWTCNVAAVGVRPTALKRSYRRTQATAMATSYWGAVSVCPTLLHIDLKTTLSATGIPDSEPTYLRTVDYNVVGTVVGDLCVDVLALRFKPTLVDPVGNKLANVSVVVLNTSAFCSASNAIGNFRARLAASGDTDVTGQIVISEPSTKDYTSNASHRTDSIVIRNRTLLTAWHKWWEGGTKLIAIANSQNGTGSTAPESYAANDFQVSYRKIGSVFSRVALDMSAPQSPTVALAVDANYNSAASTTGLTLAYASGVTTVTPTATTQGLDEIYKLVVDYHGTTASNEAETVMPVEQSTGTLSFGAALVLDLTATPTLTTGTKVTGLNFATGSALAAPTNLTFTSLKLTGTLTINTATARTLTLTNCAGTVAVNVTGGGTLTVVLSGSTGASLVTAGAGVTVALRCSVAVFGGAAFNLVKRYGVTGAFTDLGYTAGITSNSFLVPVGQPVEVAIWTLGYLTFTRIISTTSGGFDLVADMIPEPDVDTALDVSSYLANISITYAATSFTATFNANMAVPGIEQGKAILHRLLGFEGSMRALLPPGMSTTIDIEPDEVQINKPAIFLALGAEATDVSIAGFFNTAPAKLLDPAYIINPRRPSDNLRVEIPLVKPALDVAAMAAAVRLSLESSTILAKESSVKLVVALAASN